jgi:uncharacterized protein involved in propanediol utilization
MRTDTLPLVDAVPVGPRPVHSGVCHGTLGELLQGPFVRDGQTHISIISLPIRRYSWAHFTPGDAGDLDREFVAKPKSRRAIEIYLAIHERTLPCGRWSYDSELVEGKGMASSTADIVATIRCLDSILGIRSAHELIAAILKDIERSDSVYLESHALYLSGRQEVVHRFDTEPRFHVCYIDEGGSVDTENAGGVLLDHYQRHLPDYLANLDRALDAFARRDLAAIGQASTTSAALAQVALPKRSFDIMLANRQRYGADGIVVAHTGSLIGYLLIDKPTTAAIGGLSSFFRGLGYQCRFVETGF